MLSAEERSWNIARVSNWHGQIKNNIKLKYNDKKRAIRSKKAKELR